MAFRLFEQLQANIKGVRINYRIGGQGPALLLIHGHPQTHWIWHGIADELAQYFTVVAADLRGHGDSERVPADSEHKHYSKRAMALDLAELMTLLGFENFAVLAHDRGARVAHRLGLDHGARIRRMMLLDIAPTLAMYENTSEDFARIYWHWFFLIRPAPLPETLLAEHPDVYLNSVMPAPELPGSPFSQTAWAEYMRCLKIPGTATAMCEDYRASATIDLEHDRADRDGGHRLDMPVRVLWGANGAIERCFDPLELWRAAASDVSGERIDSGHFMVEETPELILDQALAFFR